MGHNVYGRQSLNGVHEGGHAFILKGIGDLRSLRGCWVEKEVKAGQPNKVGGQESFDREVLVRSKSR